MRLPLILTFAVSCLAQVIAIPGPGKSYSIDFSSEDVVRELVPADPRLSVPAWLRPYPQAVPSYVRDEGLHVTAQYLVSGNARQIAEYYRAQVERKGLDALLRPHGNGYELRGSDGGEFPVLFVKVFPDNGSMRVNISYGHTRQSRRGLRMTEATLDLAFVSQHPGRVLLQDRHTKRYFYFSDSAVQRHGQAEEAGNGLPRPYRAWMPIFREADLEGQMEKERMWTSAADWEPVVTLIGKPDAGGRAFAFYRDRLAQAAMVSSVKPTVSRGRSSGGVIDGYGPDGKSRFRVVVSCPNPGDPAVIEVYVASLLPEQWVSARR